MMKLLTFLFAFVLMCVASRAAEEAGPTDFATHFYGSSENLNRAKDEKEDRSRIPTKALRECNSSLSFEA